VRSRVSVVHLVLLRVDKTSRSDEAFDGFVDTVVRARDGCSACSQICSPGIPTHPWITGDALLGFVAVGGCG